MTPISSASDSLSLSPSGKLLMLPMGVPSGQLSKVVTGSLSEISYIYVQVAFRVAF